MRKGVVLLAAAIALMACRQPVKTLDARLAGEIAAFDGPPAVPTFLLTDRNGAVARVFYGAPANVHKEITRELARVR